MLERELSISTMTTEMFLLFPALNPASELPTDPDELPKNALPTDPDQLQLPLPLLLVLESLDSELTTARSTSIASSTCMTALSFEMAQLRISLPEMHEPFVNKFDRSTIASVSGLVKFAVANHGYAAKAEKRASMVS